MVDEIEVAEDGRCRAEVVVINRFQWEGEVSQCVVTAVKAGENRVVLVNPLFLFLCYVKTHLAGAAHAYLPVHGQKLHVRVCLQLPVNGFLRRCGKVKRFTLLTHYLEETYLRTVALAGGEGNLLVISQEIQCLFHVCLVTDGETFLVVCRLLQLVHHSVGIVLYGDVAVALCVNNQVILAQTVVAGLPAFLIEDTCR